MWIIQQTFTEQGQPQQWVDHTTYDAECELALAWLFYYADKYPHFKWRLVRQ